MALVAPRPPLPRRRPTATGRASDADLVRAAAEGDESAIEAIDVRYRAALERYCRTVVLQHDDAEDAAQAALAAGLRAITEGRAEPTALRAWLYRIAHHEALAVLRRRPPVADADPADEAVAELVPAASDRTAERERLAELLDDLRALPERQRCALVLHELGGLRHEEIASALSLPSDAAARQAVSTARRTLRRRRRRDLHVLFPAGPAVALASAGAGAGAAGVAAVGGASGIGAIGAWIAGAGVAAKCAAVCAAIGAIGAGSLAVVEPERPAERDAVAEAPAPETTPASPAGDGAAEAARARASAAAERERATERRAAERRRREAAVERAQARRESAEPQVRAEAPAPAAAEEPDVVEVQVSGDAGAIIPERSAPAETAGPAPAAERRATPGTSVVVEDSQVGSIVAEGTSADAVVIETP